MPQIRSGTRAQLERNASPVPYRDLWYETDTTIKIPHRQGNGVVKEVVYYHYKVGFRDHLYRDLPYTGWTHDPNLAFDIINGDGGPGFAFTGGIPGQVWGVIAGAPPTYGWINVPAATGVADGVYGAITVLGGYWDISPSFIDLYHLSNNVLNYFVDPSDLAAVAFSGDYNDLINAPVLATVATTGDYNDLINTPAFGTAAYTNASDYATAAQGATADSALQPPAGAVLGDVLTFDGTNWIAAAPTGGGGGSTEVLSYANFFFQGVSYNGTSLSAATGTSHTLHSWANPPAALTAYHSQLHWYHKVVEATHAKRIRLHCHASSAGTYAANFKMLLKYRTVAAGFNGTAANWNDIGGVGTTPTTAVIAPGGSNVVYSSSWVTFDNAAKTDILIGLFGIDGDSVADPAFSAIYFEVEYSTTVTAGGGGALADGVYGDITISGGGTVFSLNAATVNLLQLHPDVYTYLDATYVQPADLHAVAFSGDYNDLINPPWTVPSAGMAATYVLTANSGVPGDYAWAPSAGGGGGTTITLSITDSARPCQLYGYAFLTGKGKYELDKVYGLSGHNGGMRLKDLYTVAQVKVKFQKFYYWAVEGSVTPVGVSYGTTYPRKHITEAQFMELYHGVACHNEAFLQDTEAYNAIFWPAGHYPLNYPCLLGRNWIVGVGAGHTTGITYCTSVSVEHQHWQHPDPAFNWQYAVWTFSYNRAWSLKNMTPFLARLVDQSVGGMIYEEGGGIDGFYIIGGCSYLYHNPNYGSNGVTLTSTGEAFKVGTLYIYGMNTHGLHIQGMTPLEVENVSVFRNGYYGIAFQGASGSTGHFGMVSGDDNSALIGFYGSRGGGSIRFDAIKSESGAFDPIRGQIILHAIGDHTSSGGGTFVTRGAFLNLSFGVISAAHTDGHSQFADFVVEGAWQVPWGTGTSYGSAIVVESYRAFEQANGVLGQACTHHLLHDLVFDKAWGKSTWNPDFYNQKSLGFTWTPGRFSINSTAYNYTPVEVVVPNPDTPVTLANNTAVKRYGMYTPTDPWAVGYYPPYDITFGMGDIRPEWDHNQDAAVMAIGGGGVFNDGGGSDPSHYKLCYAGAMAGPHALGASVTATGRRFAYYNRQECPVSGTNTATLPNTIAGGTFTQLAATAATTCNIVHNGDGTATITHVGTGAGVAQFSYLPPGAWVASEFCIEFA